MKEVTIPSNLGSIEKDVKSKMALMLGLAIAPSNAKQYDTLRKENNDYIKKVKATIDEAREKYLEPFEAEANKYLDVLKPFEEANKDMSAKILEAKKIAFKEDMRHEFDLMVMPDANGEMPDFEEIYDYSWYTKTKAMAKELMSYKVKAFAMSKDKVRAYIMFDGSKEQLKGLKEYCYKNKLGVEITELEGKDGKGSNGLAF